jgi:hypothetical protein
MLAVRVFVKNELLIFGFGTTDLDAEIDVGVTANKLPAHAELEPMVNTTVRRIPTVDFFIFIATPPLFDGHQTPHAFSLEDN